MLQPVAGIAGAPHNAVVAQGIGSVLWTEGLKVAIRAAIKMFIKVLIKAVVRLGLGEVRNGWVHRRWVSPLPCTAQKILGVPVSITCVFETSRAGAQPKGSGLQAMSDCPRNPVSTRRVRTRTQKHARNDRSAQ